MADYRSYDEDSLELTPENPFFLDHVSRYWWVQPLARGKTALDCACGKGYGSFILSRTASEVTGIDLNSKSLGIARSHFSGANLRYEECDVFELEKLGKKFDVITAFEVIEHLPPNRTDEFLTGLKRALNPGGKLYLSTPNHDVVLKSGSSVPEFHINNFPAADLRAALKRHFESVEVLGQFRERAGISRWVFDFDYLNLRHVLGGWIKRILKKPLLQTAGQRNPDHSSVLDLFESPAPGVQNYRFSPRHWRQAGLTVAVCSED